MKLWQKCVLGLLFIVSLGAVIVGWQGGIITGDTPMAPPPTTSSSEPTIQPQASASPVPVTESVSSSLAPSPEPTPPSSVEPQMVDIDSTPVHFEIRQGDTQLASAKVELEQLDAANELNPSQGTVAWYGPPDWSTIPGNLSGHPGIFAAHVTYGGRPDVFYELAEVRAGDIVTVTYDNGAQATFAVDAEPVSVGKNDVIDLSDTDYAWVWQLDEPGRKISIFTCDPSQGRDLSGHALNNWVVQATRIS